MDKPKLVNIISRIAQLIIENCETDKEVEQIKEGVEKYTGLIKSISQT